MALTDTRIRNAKAESKPLKLTDGAGLYLEVRPSGSKLWRYRYRIAGKENVYAIGPYPEVSLAEAREERAQARKLVKQSIHPAQFRKLDRVRREGEHANTFRALAEEWLAQNRGRWTARSYDQRERLLKRDVLPTIGKLPMRQVTPAHALEILRRIEKRAPSLAVLARQCIGAISSHAISTLRADVDPTAPVRRALKARKPKSKEPLTQAELSGFIADLGRYQGHFSNLVALRFMLLTLARTKEVVGARWDEVDLEQGLWRLPSERMKAREPHTGPISRQAVDLLRRLHGVTGGGEFLFPNRRSPRKPVSIGVLAKMVVRMGYSGRFSPHGIRVTGSTMLNEMGYRPDVIERQLAHAERNKVRAAYNRAEYLPERRQMMQAWGDFLDALEGRDQVVPLRTAGSSAST